MKYNPPIQSKADKAALDSLIVEIEKRIVKQKEEENNFKTFNLNTSTADEIVEAGLPNYLAERIVNYRGKVAPFSEKTDLLKIYGIDSAYYLRLSSFIKVTKSENSISEFNISENIEIKSSTYGKANFKDKREIIKPFDINKADASQLQKIYGIGPSYSERIIKYRNLLGGFSSLNQLKEVYGLKKESIDSIKAYSFVENNSQLKKYPINLISADSLVKHPYIRYKDANLLINYRNQHGYYTSENDLYKIIALDSSWIKKVIPYLSFQ
ncbi:helix-hairpin-helix domain-containing protein [Marivirga arenosa]|uniref:Helix-hairpin-helix domain-containing protein n=1 Tax=Marivirga arenosa TaxID=3059076 RepID=A0AA52EZW1_9BACT|nr:helix-hairpin-helix domain-containing protein [Marivirga sp. BKB1-2]WNB17813.1 helix-hairpin-helix domain-containing protein [Marivirga sp. BKB1-2]